jgi:hypothetical protein
MSLGVIPLFPQILSGGDKYARTVHESLYYPPEDYARMVAAVKWLKSLPNSEIDSLRGCCRSLTSPHHGSAYYEAFAGFVERVAELPRISSAQFEKRPLRPSDAIPFGLLRRFYDRGFLVRTPIRRAVA